MIKRLSTPIFSLLLCICAHTGLSGQQVTIHSHNDYRQHAPFHEARAAGAGSIEVDVFVSVDGRLLVAHDAAELPTAPTFDELYLDPMLKSRDRTGDKGGYQLLVDLKTPASTTLEKILEKLNPRRETFDPALNPDAVRIVISGNRPAPSEWADYPGWVFFDGSLDVTYTPDELARVAMISEPFDKYSRWNGKGYIVDSEKSSLAGAIGKAHALGKPIRFWDTPDGFTAWWRLHDMGVDVINTDRPRACSDFFRRARSFSRTPAAPIPVYIPTYENDGSDKPVRNVILMIGDGMGLAALKSAETVNGDLTITKLKHTGLQSTHAAGDNFTTDSAGAGSSIATGEHNRNRHIAMSPSGKAYPSITEILSAHGFACGVVTHGPIADATPAAFYGHTTDRDNSDEITSYLPNGNLTLLAGSGGRVLSRRNDGRELMKELTPIYDIVGSIAQIAGAARKTICIDERMGRPTSEENIGLLAEATRAAIRKLDSTGDEGFFLMVEGAKIDYAGHDNSLAGTVMETLGFDLAVAEALRFADRDGATLVVVTADHETGGLTLVDGDPATGTIIAIYMTDDHTPIPVPVFAYGPGAEAFGGVYPNIEISTRILSSINLSQTN